MKRAVEPELLDELPADDPRAVRSRRDLRLLNGLMLHASVFHAALVREIKRPPQVIAEIGAGDGTLALKLAKRLHRLWPDVHLILVDRQSLVSDETLNTFGELGWKAEVAVADVFEWISSAHSLDLVLANLFLHHFSDEKLRALFVLIAERSRCLVACETRRDWPSILVCRYLGLMGCNSVTRHDALASVRAGFMGNELSALWPAGTGWELNERSAFISTHLFVASLRGLRNTDWDHETANEDGDSSPRLLRRLMESLNVSRNTRWEHEPLNEVRADSRRLLRRFVERCANP